MPPDFGPQSAACALQRLPRLWHQESREISNDRFEGWHFRRQVPGERFPLALFRIRQFPNHAAPFAGFRQIGT
jgi:hypothetical protein